MSNILYKKKDKKGDGYHWMLFEVRVEDIISPKKWWSFIVGMIRGQVIKPHIIQQVHMRQILCRPCIEAGRCIDCGCRMPEKTYVFDEKCSMGYWAEIETDAEEWKRRCEEYGISFGITIGKGNEKITIK